MEREYMDYDVVIVGAGPSGLGAACRLKQVNPDISVCVVEKGSEVGAHISPALYLNPRPLNELFPDWKELGAPLLTPVTAIKFTSSRPEKSIKVPNLFAPKTMHNRQLYYQPGQSCAAGWPSRQRTLV